MGLFSKVGDFVNDVLGGTSSAKQAQKYQLEQMKIQNEYNEKYGKNAHQWEVEDLQKAGLNPALSAGGSSAGAIAGSSVSSGSGISSTNGNINDLVNMSSNLVTALSQKELNDTTSAKTEAETNTLLTNLKYIPKEKQAQLNNMLVDKQLKEEEIKKYKMGKIADYVGTGSKSAKKIHNMIDKGVDKYLSSIFD